MPNTIEGAIAYAHAHPTNNGGTWHAWCEAFVYRAGGFTGAGYPTAVLSGNASIPLNGGPAPRGAIHYWGGTTQGHVGFELGGGLILMASDGVTTLWGTAMGTATRAEYEPRKPAMRYRGWSLRHGTETLAPSSTSTAGVGVTTTVGNSMPLDAGDHTWLDQLGTAVIQQVTAALTPSINEAIRIGNVNYTLLNQVLAKPSTLVDPAKLADALKSAGLTVTIDSAAIAVALDASLSDNFAAIPGAVRNAIIK